MRNFLRFLLLILCLFIGLAACGGDDEEELPTVAPTAIIPEGNETAVRPTPTSETTSSQPPTPTAAPVAEVTYDWPPQVIYSSPALGEEALLDGAITIRFDQPMDEASVEKAFSIVSTTDSQRPVAGVFSWPRPDTLVFTPQSQLLREQRYKVVVANTAVAMTGRAMSDMVSLDLQTVGFLEVAQVIPASDVKGVQTDSAITVLFNRPVVPLVATSQQTNLPQPLQITPAVSGSGEWVSTSIYRFVPDEPLAGATAYEVTVVGGLEDITGGLLASDYNWSFITLSPSVVSIEPADGTTGFVPTRPITLTFNMPMDRTSTESAVSLQANGDEPSVTYTWSENGRILTLMPVDRLQLAATYQLQVGQGARSATGLATLDRETNSTFTTVLLPGISYTIPENNGLVPQYQRGFQIEFVSPMRFDTLEQTIQIDPAPEADTLNYYYGEEGTNFYVDFELLRNTRYTITVPGTTADPYGNTLGREYVFTFQTPDYPPLASFNLPQNVTYLSTSFATEVDILHRNVSSLYVELHNLGLPIGLINTPYEVYNYQPASDPVAVFNVFVSNASGEVGVYTLPLANGGALPPGAYLMRLSAPELLPDTQFWQNQNQLLIVSDTNLVIREMFEAVHVWVTDIETGRQVVGSPVAFYNQTGVEIGTAVTDENGFASIPYTPDQGYLAGVTVVSGQPGSSGFGVGNSTWSGGVSPWRLGINYGYNAPTDLFVYLYTDRPIYRPGDTVYFKGIVRRPEDGRYSPPTRESVTVNLTPLFYTENTNPEVFTFTLDESGTFTGEYTLSEEMQLGTYQLYVGGQDFEGYRSFTVAEYRAPEFLITMTADQPEALRGETVDVWLDASYFFGGPVSDVAVNWTIYQDTYYPDIPGPFYSFSDDGQFFYSDPPLFGGGAVGAFGNYLLGGQGVTDENGRLRITLPANLLQDVAEGGRIVTVEATVSDLSNFPVTSHTSVIFHPAETYVGVVPADYVALAGAETDINLLTVDWEGQAKAGQTVEVIFYRREWERNRRSQFGLYFTDWTPIDTEVGRDSATTDAQGKAVVSFVPEDGGTYLAVATVTDNSGRSHTSSTAVWALSATYAGWRTDPKERSMPLIPDKQNYVPGDVARILVQSPFAGPVNAWLTIERGRLIEQRVVRLNSNSEVIEIPISPQFAPNVFVSVTAVKPVDPNSDTPFADIRLGITELVVSPEQLGLTVTLTPDETSYQPGDTATYNVRVTNFRGQGVPSEISLALVDLAVLTLKADNAPNILDAFYTRQPYRAQVGGSLFISGEGLEIEVPQEGGGLGGGGGDAVSEEALGRAVGEEEDVRRDFPDTAYWEASIQTDATGQATVEIPLPDSLTTWRLSSKAFSPDNLVGQSSVDVVVSLPLLIRPVTPRFFTVGDEIDLGAIVNNNTDQAIEAVVTLIADGLVLRGQAGQTVTIPANGRSLVQWRALVNDVAWVDLTFRVNGGGFTDATKPTFGEGPDNLIPVYRYDAEDIVGTSGVLTEAGLQVEAILLPPAVDTREGSVEVNVSPSLAAAILQALDYNNDWYYDPVCAHAIANRLLPNVAVKRAIDELDLDRPQLANTLDGLILSDLAMIEQLVKDSGGWGWCYSLDTDPWLTAYILLAMAKAEESGYEVNTAVLTGATNYLEGQLLQVSRLNSSWEINRQAFFLYVLAERGQEMTEQADDLFAEHRALLDPYAKALLALVYELNGSQGNNQQALLADLNDGIILSATGAHWEDAQPDWDNLNSDIRGTAVIIGALATIAPDTAYVPQAVRWLMSARTATYWTSTHETAWSILALTDWLAATGELEASYDYAVSLNTAEVADGSFSQANILESEQLSLPVADLLLDEVNFLGFERGSGNGRLYYTVYLNSFINAETVSAISRGITVQRFYYDAACDPTAQTCEPITEIQAGQQIRVELSLIAPNDLVYVTLEDPIPSGAEAIDPGLDTSASAFALGWQRTDLSYQYGYWGWWFFNHIEFRDEKVVFHANFLPAGTYQYTYYLQTNISGEFQVMPAIAREEFFPEVFGRSDGMVFVISQ